MCSCLFAVYERVLLALVHTSRLCAALSTGQEVLAVLYFYLYTGTFVHCNSMGEILARKLVQTRILASIHVYIYIHIL